MDRMDRMTKQSRKAAITGQWADIIYLMYVNRQLQKYQILVENARDIMLLVGMDGIILEANSAAVPAYGYTREELLSLYIYHLRDNSTELQIDAQMKMAEKQGILFETVHRRKDNTIFPVEVSSQGIYIGEERVLLSIIRDISDRKKAENQLKYMETHDFLTGIPNRYYLEEYLKNVVLPVHRKCKGALLFLDVDNFKVINDSFGHTAGDNLLISLGKKLRESVKQEDFVARLGGDEFALVLRDVSVDAAKKEARNLIQLLSETNFPIDSEGNCCNLNSSIGITKIDGTVDTQKLFAYADVALYAAKEQGKCRVIAIEDSNDKQRLSESNDTVKLILDCLRNDRFILHYQPIMSEQGILHYEALLRILDKEGNIIYPGSFITTSERFGLMSQIDRWVVQHAMEFLADNPNISVFVNVSSLSLGDTELLEYIESSLLVKGIKPARMGFEITETAAVKDLMRAEQWISRMKNFGCKFALDDFGVGFTSFKYIQTLPVDYIKIDGSFVKNLDADPTQRALVQAMNAVAHALGKKTIAEFVENEVIWRIIQELGVDFGQGYFLGKPCALPCHQNL